MALNWIRHHLPFRTNPLERRQAKPQMVQMVRKERHQKGAGAHNEDAVQLTEG